MDKGEKIKELVTIKKKGLKDENTKLVSNANKSLNNIIKDSIKTAQKVLGAENIYKEYMISNEEHINQIVAVNVEVETVEEAKVLIHQVDFRYVFGLEAFALDEAFECDFINMEHRISFAFGSAEEADGAMGKEIAKYQGKEINKSGYERFGMFVREVIVKDGKTEAWISYSCCRNKYLYNVGNNTKEDYAITDTFDILDLYQVFMKCDIKKAIQGLCQLLGIRVKQIEAIRNRYNGCKEFVKANLTKDRFPILYQLIGEHISKLYMLLDEAIDKLFYHKKTNDRWTFSSSMGHLSLIIGKSKSTVNAVFNTCTLLGFVYKPLLDDGKFINWDRNEITHFYIQEYSEELFEKAERIAKIMLYDGKRVTATSFSYKNCIEKFGLEMADSIYRDKVTKAKAS